MFASYQKNKEPETKNLKLEWRVIRDTSGCPKFFISCISILSLNATSTDIATLGLHLGFSAKLRIWQVSTCKMEPLSGTIITGPSTQPSTELVSFNVVWCPHPNCCPHQESICGVPPQNTFFLCDAPPPQCSLMLCHTWLCLGV